jgi:diguanylate cyclase (GGDEF)-like protein
MAVVLVLFIVMSTVSLTSLELLQGNARVVNYVGIVRGATQKLVKEELMGYPNDAEIKRLDGIVNDLLEGGGDNKLVVLDDESYLENMLRVKGSWNELKRDIADVRNGGSQSQQKLYDASQEYFELVNATVFSAEEYSEAQVIRISGIMISINVIFVLLIAVGAVFAVRSAREKHRADVLGKIAYVDPLTEIANRASCEKLIGEWIGQPPEQDVWAFMFDMNDLKLTNDFLGHQGGDKIIKDFSSILAESAEPYGFFGRYGGDEFLGLFLGCDEEAAERFLNDIHQKTNEDNEVRSNKLEQISYAAGYAHGNLSYVDIDDIIHEADNQMYLDKRRIKKANISTW